MKKSGEGSAKNILVRLGFKKSGGVPAAAASTPTAPTTAKPKGLPPREAPRAFDEDTMSKYPNFDAMCRDIRDFPTCRTPLLNALISSDVLFSDYICDIENLQILMTMLPDKEDYFIDKILRVPACYGTFMRGFRHLPAFLELFKDSEERQSKILNAALDNEEIQPYFYVTIESIEIGIKQYPSYRKKILDNLANNKKFFERCLNIRREDFYAFIKKHADYTERFIEYIFTSEAIYRDIIHLGGVYEFLEQFPNLLDRFVSFVLSDDKRFSSEFSRFEDIFEFAKKYPDNPAGPENFRYIQRMITKALSMESYVKQTIYCYDRILDIDKLDPHLAKTILERVLADEEWILRLIQGTLPLTDAFNSALLKPLADAYLQLLFKNPERFTHHMTLEWQLDDMLAIVPEDQKPKLPLYFQIYTRENPLPVVLNKHCHDAITINELSAHIGRVGQTLELDTVKQLYDQTAKRLVNAKECGESEAYQLALQNLQKSISVWSEKSQSDRLRFITSTAVEQQKEQTSPKNPIFKQ